MENPIPKLNTTNADHITYHAGMLQVTVLGGVRLEGLDRMRVTLKLSVLKDADNAEHSSGITHNEYASIRHNLDLYNDNQVEKLVRKIAERLEVGTSISSTTLMDLTDELESYRMEMLEKQDQVVCQIIRLE